MLLPDTTTLAAFVAASVVLALVPGPVVIYVVARSVTHGRSSGLTSVAGVAAGNWCNAVGASVGLAAVFAVSGTAFTVVKLAGAAYLVYLGVQTIRSPSPNQKQNKPSATATNRVFRDGFLIALLNPKTALFFAAFLPQFMTADAQPAIQAVLLGSLFVLIAALTDSAYALLASTSSRYVSRSLAVQRGGRFLGGAAFIGLGLVTAVTGDR
ncbi:MAG: LysE family translocator [Woeseiaceae bacterium]|nr:LysE family translocator [Woeseiaceae bacterium]